MEQQDKQAPFIRRQARGSKGNMLINAHGTIDVFAGTDVAKPTPRRRVGPGREEAPRQGPVLLRGQAQTISSSRTKSGHSAGRGPAGDWFPDGGSGPCRKDHRRLPFEPSDVAYRLFTPGEPKTDAGDALSIAEAARILPHVRRSIPVAEEQAVELSMLYGFDDDM